MYCNIPKYFVIVEKLLLVWIAVGLCQVNYFGDTRDILNFYPFLKKQGKSGIHIVKIFITCLSYIYHVHI